MLTTGELKITIGAGPAARTHRLEFAPIALLASCPTKHECPAPLLKLFRCVIPVEPYTGVELQGVLEVEAKKMQISFGPAAAELLVKYADGDSGVLINRFQRVVDKVKQTESNTLPFLTMGEIAMALKRLRIEPSQAPPDFTLGNIDTLTGKEFEALISALLIKMGFQAEQTKDSGDGGIDIIAFLDMPFVGGRYIFQCKRFKDGNNVGEPVIRDLNGTVDADRALKGICVTTSDFTAQARDFASRAGVELVNRQRLIQLLEEYGFRLSS